jgi:hypothetical protein
VIPTSKHVRLHFERTGVEKLATVMTVAGLAGLISLRRAGPVVYPIPKRRRRSTRLRHEGEAWSGVTEATMFGAWPPGSDGSEDAWLFDWGDDLNHLAGLSRLDPVDDRDEPQSDSRWLQTANSDASDAASQLVWPPDGNAPDDRWPPGESS